MQPFIRICCKLIMMWDPKQRLFANIHFFVKIVKFGNPYFDGFGTDSYETHINKIRRNKASSEANFFA